MEDRKRAIVQLSWDGTAFWVSGPRSLYLKEELKSDARENIAAEIGAGWDPTHHQPTDVFSHFSDGDFRLGLNAIQTTLGAVAQLAGAQLWQVAPSAQ